MNILLTENGCIAIAEGPFGKASMEWENPPRRTRDTDGNWVDSGVTWQTPTGLPLWRSRVNAYDHYGRVQELCLWVASVKNPKIALEDLNLLDGGE